MALQTVSVSTLVSKIKGLLEGEFRQIFVEGEISNLSSSSTGHWYFTLSDNNSSVSVALFKMDAMRNSVIRSLKDGDKIICTGSIGVYARRGTFQIIAKQIVKAGKGDLNAKFEFLKKKLGTEGLFDLECKQEIPAFPKRVAVITAEGAAALQDFLNVYKRRSLSMDVIIIPSLVQGDKASLLIRKALEKAQKIKDVDLIVLTRGGGSMEDLWAFNDEQLAREVFACRIPIVSAIGHQVDYVLTDYVADLRCETPTAAAEIITQPQTEIISRLNSVKTRLSFELSKNLSKVSSAIEDYHPRRFSEIILKKFYSLSQRLSELKFWDRFYEMTRIHEKHQWLDEISSRMKYVFEKRMQNIKFKIEKNEQLLNSLGPQKVLERGYSYINSGKNVITSKKEFDALKSNQKLNITFHDGKGSVSKTEGKESV